MVCYACRDKGAVGGCSVCGKKISICGKGATTVTTELLQKSSIPAEYKDVVWDKELLMYTHPHKSDNEDFRIYCDQLTKIQNIFRNGELPQQSAIIIAERAMGKLTFAYICMRYALENGYTVCPILDNTQIKRIKSISSDNPRSYALYRQPTVEEIQYSDVLFITVDKDNYGSALRTIESVIDERARLSLSTFVISRFSLASMSQFEKKGSYETLQESTRRYNNKKFPSIIVCN